MDATALARGFGPALGQRRQDMIDEVGRDLCHTSGIAGGKNGAAPTEEGSQKIVTALTAARPRNAVGQNAALQVGTLLVLGVRRDALFLPLVAPQRKEGLQMML